MMERKKYVESGTGQVGFLFHDERKGTWVFALFVGGPDPYVPAGEWTTESEAETAISQMGYEASET